jgi:hypothetical protein
MENYQFFTLLGLLATGFGWMIIQLFKMKAEVASLKIEMLKEIRGLDARLSHLEGYLIGSGQKTGTEKK